MKGLCPSIGQTLKWLNSAACSHKRSCPDPIIPKICQQWWEGYAPVITSKISTNHISYSNVKEIWSPPRNSYASKPSSTKRGVFLCVKYTRWNAPIMSHVPMWKKRHLISSKEWTWLKNPSSTKKSMPRHNGHPIKKLSKMVMPQSKDHTMTPGPTQSECSRTNPKYRSHKSYQTQCVMSWPQGALKTQDIT